MFTFLPRFLCRMNLLYSIFRPFGMRMANGLIGRTRPEINLRQGVVRGIEEKLPNHGSYYCFKGIPYAEPPIGDLRFEVYRLLIVLRTIDFIHSDFAATTATAEVQRSCSGLQQRA